MAAQILSCKNESFVIWSKYFTVLFRWIISFWNPLTPLLKFHSIQKLAYSGINTLEWYENPTPTQIYIVCPQKQFSWVILLTYLLLWESLLAKKKLCNGFWVSCDKSGLLEVLQPPTWLQVELFHTIQKFPGWISWDILLFMKSLERWVCVFLTLFFWTWVVSCPNTISCIRRKTRTGGPVTSGKLSNKKTSCKLSLLPIQLTLLVLAG